MSAPAIRGSPKSAGFVKQPPLDETPCRRYRLPQSRAAPGASGRLRSCAGPALMRTSTPPFERPVFIYGLAFRVGQSCIIVTPVSCFTLRTLHGDVLVR